jgi:RNA polymerase sigma-70 factor (ECF subfamily)
VRQRRALVMHELEGRSHAEIARTLRVSTGATKALVCRARGALADARAAA